MQQAIKEWLSRLLTEHTPAEGPRLAAQITPHIEDALKASALDMLRQCSVEQFGDADESDSVKEWTVSVNEAVAAAIRRVEHKRET